MSTTADKGLATTAEGGLVMTVTQRTDGRDRLADAAAKEEMADRLATLADIIEDVRRQLTALRPRPPEPHGGWCGGEFGAGGKFGEHDCTREAAS